MGLGLSEANSDKFDFKRERSEDFKRLYSGLLSLSIYKGLYKAGSFFQKVMNLLSAMHRNDLWGDEGFFRLSGEVFTAHYSQKLLDEILRDENPFTELLAQDEPLINLEHEVLPLAYRDIKILSRLNSLNFSFFTDEMSFAFKPDLPSCEKQDTVDILNLNESSKADLDKLADRLKTYYSINGYGRFIDSSAFFWRNSELRAVTNPDPIRLENLKEYNYQRDIVVSNTLSFLKGNEANNILLYGDRGTGKSSTVKAVLNEYKGNKLRLIEIAKKDLETLPRLTEILENSPMKFIVFIDDLSFGEDDEDFSTLKAVLEGGVSSLPRNVLIYATSNRRHLIKESFSARKGDELHRADTIQETVSLSDRFGIVLTYLIPNKKTFGEIVIKMAKDYDVEMDDDKLLELAERWVLERGARSPRYAKQFILDLKGRL